MEEIISPPFPKLSSNPKQMYHYLLELRNWVIDQIDWSNEHASRLNAPDMFMLEKAQIPVPCSFEVYSNLSVVDMFLSWKSIRTIRENYDLVVRSYEEEQDWNSDPCIYHRLQLVRAAAIVLSLAFLDREKREAKEMAMLNKQKQEAFNAVKKFFAQNYDGFNIDDNEQNDDDIDYDALFNPPESE